MADHDSIQKRAYEIWERQGRPNGRHEEHWELARQELSPAEPVNVEAPAKKTNPKTAKVPAPAKKPSKSQPALNA